MPASSKIERQIRPNRSTPWFPGGAFSSTGFSSSSNGFAFNGGSSAMTSSEGGGGGFNGFGGGATGRSVRSFLYWDSTRLFEQAALAFIEGRGFVDMMRHQCTLWKVWQSWNMRKWRVRTSFGAVRGRVFNGVRASDELAFIERRSFIGTMQRKFAWWKIKELWGFTGFRGTQARWDNVKCLFVN